MLRSFLFIVSFSGLLAGCALPGAAAAPTPYPADYLPTVIYQTAQAINATELASVTPSVVPTETSTPIPPTPEATITPTPLPGVPLSAIQIFAPGPESRVASPLEVRTLAVAGASKRVEIDLYGEDGRLLARTLKLVSGYPGGDNLFVKIPFEIRAAAETGLIQVSTRDARGRMQSLSSVRVLLLSDGVSQINPAGNAVYERLVLYDLPPRTRISGGVVSLKGRFTPYNRQPLVFELVADDGKSLGTRLVTVDNKDAQQTFDTTVPYKVDKLTEARLFVQQADNVLDGPVYVYSQELVLNP